MSAATEEHEILRIVNVQVKDSSVLNLQTILKPAQVVFNASRATNAIVRDAERGPSIDILSLGHADRIEELESRFDESAELAKSPFGPRRQARVRNGDWYPAGVGFRDQVRPNLGLDQNDPDRTDYGKCPPHNRPKVERIVHDLDPIRGIFGGERKTRRSSSCYN